MQISVAVFSLLLLTACCFQVYCAPAGVSAPTSCCFKFVKKRIPQGQVQSYYITSGLCPNPGVIFISKKGREICANPSDKWVKDLIQLNTNSA